MNQPIIFIIVLMPQEQFCVTDSWIRAVFAERITLGLKAYFFRTRRWIAMRARKVISYWKSRYQACTTSLSTS
jgi:hypothetical protein